MPKPDHLLTDATDQALTARLVRHAAQVMVALVEGTGIQAVSDAAEERLRRACGSLGGSTTQTT